MFKTLKWIYQLGRQHERMRLKRIATEFIQSSQFNQQQYGLNQIMHPGMSDEDRKRARKDKEAMRLEIDQAVVNILSQMIYPDPSSRQEVKLAPAAIDDERL